MAPGHFLYGSKEPGPGEGPVILSGTAERVGGLRHDRLGHGGERR